MILFVTVRINSMWAKVGGTLQNIKRDACSLQISDINIYIIVAYKFIKYVPYVLTYLFFY
jgi:hypothetical protein